MTRRSQKGREVRAVEIFRTHFDGFPEGGVLPHETPDFLLGGQLGLEVTQLVRSPELSASSSAMEEGYEGAVCTIASDSWAERRPNDPVRVDLIWYKGRARGPDPAALADKLVRLVADSLSNVPLELRDLGWDELGDPDLQQHLHSVSVMRMKPTWPSQWGGGFSGMPDLFPGEVQAQISRKDPKVQLARERIQPVWLLVYAEWSSGSTSGTLTDEARAHTYVSSADRVFFQEWFTGRVDELTVTDRPISDRTE